MSDFQPEAVEPRSMHIFLSWKYAVRMGFRFFLTTQSAGEFLSLEGLKIVDLSPTPTK